LVPAAGYREGQCLTRFSIVRSRCGVELCIEFAAQMRCELFGDHSIGSLYAESPACHDVRNELHTAE
jgi:hypothetical protein